MGSKMSVRKGWSWRCDSKSQLYWYSFFYICLGLIISEILDVATLRALDISCGNHGISRLQVWVDWIVLPFGNVIFNGFITTHLLTTGVPSIKDNYLKPKPNIAQWMASTNLALFSVTHCLPSSKWFCAAINDSCIIFICPSWVWRLSYKQHEWFWHVNTYFLLCTIVFILIIYKVYHYQALMACVVTQRLVRGSLVEISFYLYARYWISRWALTLNVCRRRELSTNVTWSHSVTARSSRWAYYFPYSGCRNKKVPAVTRSHQQ